MEDDFHPRKCFNLIHDRILSSVIGRSLLKCTLRVVVFMYLFYFFINEPDIFIYYIFNTVCSSFVLMIDRVGFMLI